MTIGGIRKLSLIDYPGRPSAVVFTQGCNFRCTYCHNPELVHPRLFGEPLHADEVLSFLDTRKGLIEGVVVTGGEPLVQDGLAPFLRRVRAMGYGVKLDTNGSEPDRLEELLGEGLVDYVAMDFKAPLGKYGRTTRVVTGREGLIRSLEMITGCGISYEIRTTVFSGLEMGDLLEMAAELQSMKVESYFLQVFKPFSGCGEDLSPGYPDMESLHAVLADRFVRCGIRNMNPDPGTKGRRNRYEQGGLRVCWS